MTTKEQSKGHRGKTQENKSQSITGTSHAPPINANSKTITITKNPLSSSAFDTSKNYDSSVQQDLSGINPPHIPAI